MIESNNWNVYIYIFLKKYLMKLIIDLIKILNFHKWVNLEFLLKFIFENLLYIILTHVYTSFNVKLTK